MNRRSSGEIADEVSRGPEPDIDRAESRVG